jgi:hypothetical protein
MTPPHGAARPVVPARAIARIKVARAAPGRAALLSIESPHGVSSLRAPIRALFFFSRLTPPRLRRCALQLAPVGAVFERTAHGAAALAGLVRHCPSRRSPEPVTESGRLARGGQAQGFASPGAHPFGARLKPALRMRPPRQPLPLPFSLGLCAAHGDELSGTAATQAAALSRQARPDRLGILRPGQH